MKQKHVNFLQLEMFSMIILGTLKSVKVQENINLISEHIAVEICGDHPSALWNRKRHIVTLPYKGNFLKKYPQNFLTLSDECLISRILKKN